MLLWFHSFYIWMPDLFRNCTSVWCEEWTQLYLFPYGYPAVLSPFIKKVLLFPCWLELLPSLYTKFHRHLSYFCVFHSVLLVCKSIHKPIPHCFNYRSFIMFSYLEGNFPHIVLLFLGFSWLFIFNHNIYTNLSSLRKKTWWHI